MAAPEQHLALVFLGDAVAAALWQSVGRQPTVIAQSSFSPLDNLTLPSINAALDPALDQLGEAGLSVKDCLFCVPAAWTDEAGLRSDKKGLLKSITDDLVLKPLGFVVNSDALAAADKERTDQPLSGLIVYATDLNLSADYYQSGELRQSEELGRSQPEADCKELLARFTTKPKRLLLIEGQNPTDTTKLATVLKQQTGLEAETIPRTELLRSVIVAGGGAVTSEIPLPEATPAPKTEEEAAFTPPDFLIHRAEEKPVEEIAETTTAAPTRPRLPKFHWPKMKKLSWPRVNQGRWPILGALGIVLLLLAGGWFWLNRSYTAAVTVLVKTQKFETEETFLLATADAPVASASVSALRATPVTESITLDKEVPTTGSKIIGEKASGTVTIYNRTSQSKTFSAGTKLVAGKLNFILNNEITVASISGEYAPGTAETSVSAVEIGPGSNLPKETEFRIANFDVSSYVAKNKSALTGGTSREIQAVSGKDIDQAKKDLLSAAQTQLTERFASLATDEEPVLFTGVTRIIEEKSSAKIGDETKFVNITIEVEGTGAKIVKDDAVTAARRIFTLPEGFTLQEETVELEPIEVHPEKDGLYLRARLRAQGMPMVSASEIAQTIAGVYAPRAQTQLAENPKLAQAEIVLRPTWAATFFNTVPADSNRISISIRLEGAP